MLSYRIILYEDVWDNDGAWAVETTKTSDKVMYVDNTTTEGDILKQLKTFKYLESCDRRKVSTTELGKDIIEIRQKKDKKPLCRLQRVRI